MRHRQLAILVASLVMAPLQIVPALAQKLKDTSLALRASPQVAFSPARIVVTAELKDVDDALPDFYCPGLEWDWGDGTTSEASYDCEPFEAGRTEVKRRYISEHTYYSAGRFRVQLRLKRQKKVILSSATVIQVRPGARDGFGY